jgi:predicted nucleotidyltransferase
MMPKAPARPEEIFEDFASDYRKAFESDLLSIILYGSGARGEYIPKKSDLNFMIVLSESGMDGLSKAIPLVSKWHKKRVNTPLFLTPAAFSSSLDTFPIEFLNIKAAHKVVCGENFLKDLAFDKNYLRLQCEREIKGKLVQLRKHFLETAGNWRETEALISASLPTFFSLFQAIIFLKDKEPIAERHALVTTVAGDRTESRSFLGTSDNQGRTEKACFKPSNSPHGKIYWGDTKAFNLLRSIENWIETLRRVKKSIFCKPRALLFLIFWLVNKGGLIHEGKGQE